MTGPEHYAIAEEFLKRAAKAKHPENGQAFAALAQAHATLALAAATALCIPSEGAVSTDEVTGWNRVLG